jgi:hypothetical protein
MKNFGYHQPNNSARDRPDFIVTFFKEKCEPEPEMGRDAFETYDNISIQFSKRTVTVYYETIFFQNSIEVLNKHLKYEKNSKMNISKTRLYNKISRK